MSPDLVDILELQVAVDNAVLPVAQLPFAVPVDIVMPVVAIAHSQVGVAVAVELAEAVGHPSILAQALAILAVLVVPLGLKLLSMV